MQCGPLPSVDPGARSDFQHRCRWFFIFVAVFLSLLSGNFSTLDHPPYWDGITGIFSQAVWLKNNQFDLFELYRQADWLEGGPRNVVLFLLAPVYAGLYHFFTPATVFRIAHLFNILCGATVFTLFFHTSCRLMPPVLALAWCTVGVLEPIFSGQCAGIYLEMPLAAAIAGVCFYLFERRYLAAVLCSILAYFIKDSALLLGIALFAWFFVRLAVAPCLRLPRPSRMMVLIPFLLPLFWVLDKINRNEAHHQMVWSMHRIQWKAQLLFPSLAVLFAIIVLPAIWIGFRRWRGMERTGDPWERPDWVLFLLILVCGFWAAFALYPLSLCRYATMVIMPMAVLAGIFVYRAARRLSIPVACCLIAFNLFNQYGALLPPIPHALGRSGEFLERSREFLLDLEGNRRICRQLESGYSDHSIVVKYPFAQMLTMPEMGYVDKALSRVYVVGRVPDYAPVRRFVPELLDAPDTLYLYSPNVFEMFNRPFLRPAEDAEEILKDTSLSPPLVVYRRNPAGPGPPPDYR